MANNKIKIFIVSILIFGQLSFLPGLAFAQLGLSVPTTDSNNGNVPGGIPGNEVNSAFQAALAVWSKANTICEKAEQKYENGDSLAQVGFSGLAIIAGDGVLLGQLAAKITAYNGFIGCRNAILTPLQNLSAPSIYLNSLKEQQISLANSAIKTYTAKLEQVQARYNNAKQGFWKTLVFNILIKTSKSVATTLVSKLVNNYKIRDYKQYADSVATLVYDNQFIRQNYPDNQGQMMARAMLNNPLFRREVPSALFIAADATLGFDPTSLDPGDPNFYAKMALAGGAKANPYFQHNAYIANADLAHSTALAYSQNQISQSQGLKTPMNCAGSLAQQQAIDMQTEALWNQLDNRQKLFDSLVNAKQMGMKVLDSDIAKAQADLLLAQQAWDKSPDSLGANNAALSICEAIVSPPTLINKGIDEAFKSIGIKMAQYDDNNLPAFISIIGDVASQIGTSFVLGGPQGAKSAVLMNEGRLVSAVSTAAGEYVNANIAANLAKGISMDLESNSSVPNTYTLSWEINPEKVPGASFVSVVGDGVVSSTKDPKTGLPVAVRYPLAGSTSFTTTKGGTYTVTIYNSSGRALTSGTETLTVSNVLGAFIKKEPLNIRGLSVHISPRGE